ncbi:MAG: hypothetical protein AAFW76_02510 [Pseudomonadota bacterium]
MLAPLLALCLLSMPASGLAQPQPPAEFVISESGWEGGAFPVPETGEFSHCAIERPFEDGQTLAFLMNSSGRMAVGIGRTDWTLEVDTQIPGQVAVDSNPPRSVTATTPTDKLLIFPIGDDPQMISALQRGNAVALSSELASGNFPLVGTFKAIEALKACVGKAVELTQQAATQRPAPKRMTAEAIAQIMDSAGVTGIALASPDEIQGAQVPIEQAWRIGPLRGALHQEPRTRREIQIDEFAAGFAGTFEALCPGEFTTEFQPADVQRDIYAVKTGILTCNSDDGSTHTEMVIVLDDSFYSAFVHEGPSDSAQNVSEINARLAETFRSMISGQLDGGGQ